MSDVVISVENLGKKYRLRHQQARQRYSTLRDVLTDKSKSAARRLWSAVRNLHSALPASRLPPPDSSEDFWALKDVSFDVKKGQSLGIIGRNGAGKSTLLKILSRITEPTEGRIRILAAASQAFSKLGPGFILS
jgi:lipopolysaccharide transport system ATP-binding protein